MDPTIKTTRAHILQKLNEHAGMVEKCRDSDRKRHQGQSEAKASLVKVEKEAKKARGVSH